ncbi:hypothetical protein PUN28_016079 [Cardiocondyla obscurior]|uniref:Uncharacterized protein n=1 Tax=Cardiocondyla obscurior TaxID=286306 RepID=A0AAW2ET86_9HYME
MLEFLDGLAKTQLVYGPRSELTFVAAINVISTNSPPTCRSRGPRLARACGQAARIGPSIARLSPHRPGSLAAPCIEIARKVAARQRASSSNLRDFCLFFFFPFLKRRLNSLSFSEACQAYAIASS